MSAEDQGREMQDIANATGMNVIGIHSSTEGAGADIAQSIDDKLAMVRDLASDSPVSPPRAPTRRRIRWRTRCTRSSRRAGTRT